MDRLPDGVHNVVSRICVPLMPYKRPICSSPSLSHRAHTLVFWLGNKEVDLFDSVQHSLGSWTLPPCSLLPLWEKSQAKKLSLGTELWHLRGRVTWTKWNCSFSLLGFFCCYVVLEVAPWKPGFPQRLSYPWVTAWMGALWGKMVETVILPCWSALCTLCLAVLICIPSLVINHNPQHIGFSEFFETC